MGAWGKLTPEEWEEEKAWRESHSDSAGERLVDAISDATRISWGEGGKRDRDEGDYGWGGGGDSPGCGCSLKSCLTILLILVALEALGCISWYLLLTFPRWLEFIFG